MAAPVAAAPMVATPSEACYVTTAPVVVFVAAIPYRLLLRRLLLLQSLACHCSSEQSVNIWIRAINHTLTLTYYDKYI